MLLRSVPGLAPSPRTCCIHRGFGTRSDPGGPRSTTVENRGVSNVLGHHPSASFLVPGVSRASSKGGEVVVPRAIPIGTRGETASLRLRSNTTCAFQHATAVYPPSMVARDLYRCVYAPQTVNWIVQGLSAVRAWLVPRLYYRFASESQSSISCVLFAPCS